MTPRGGRWRVVLADDAADLRLLLAKLLRSDDRFDVVAEAADGRQAIEAVERERPHLLLLDLSMPVMDGLETLPIVRERFPGTLVVILSGFEAAQMEEKTSELGAAAYIEKGAAFSTLTDTLADLLS